MSGTSKLNTGDISWKRLSAFIVTLIGVGTVCGTIYAVGASRTNTVRDVSNNTTRSIDNETDIAKVNVAIGEHKETVHKLEKDMIKAIASVENTQERLDGKFNAVQASLDTLNAHLERITK